MFNPEFIKWKAAIDHNVYDHEVIVSEKWIIDSVISPIIGRCMIERLCDLPTWTHDPETCEWIEPEITEEDQLYMRLRDEFIFDCVAWGVRADIGPQLHNKIRNAGVIRTTDEQIQSVIQDDMIRNKERYENRMRFYEDRVKQFVRANKSDFPELNCDGHEPCGQCGCECYVPTHAAVTDKYNKRGTRIVGGIII